MSFTAVSFLLVPALGRPAPPELVAVRSGAGVRLGRVHLRVRLEAGGADGVSQGLLPGPVVDHLLDGRVDRLAEGLVALLDADAVTLLAEGLAHELELALVLGLGGETGQDDVVGRDRVDAAAV